MFGAESGAPVSPGWDGCVSQSGAISVPPSVTDQPGVTEGSGEIKARHIRPAVAADPTSPACCKGQNPTSPPLLPWGTSEWHRWHVLHCTGAVTPACPTRPHTLSHRNVPGRQSSSPDRPTRAEHCPAELRGRTPAGLGNASVSPG